MIVAATLAIFESSEGYLAGVAGIMYFYLHHRPVCLCSYSPAEQDWECHAVPMPRRSLY